MPLHPADVLVIHACSLPTHQAIDLMMWACHWEPELIEHDSVHAWCFFHAGEMTYRFDYRGRKP